MKPARGHEPLHLPRDDQDDGGLAREVRPPRGHEEMDNAFERMSALHRFGHVIEAAKKKQAAVLAIGALRELFTQPREILSVFIGEYMDLMGPPEVVAADGLELDARSLAVATIFFRAAMRMHSDSALSVIMVRIDKGNWLDFAKALDPEGFDAFHARLVADELRGAADQARPHGPPVPRI